MIVISSMLWIGNATGDKLYKWVDEDGAVHFSNRHPDSPNGLIDTVQESDLNDISPIKAKKIPAVKPPSINPIAYTTSCTFTIKGDTNLGTGFFISSNGYAITCRHVIEENGDHTAVMNDKTELPIGVIAKSDRYDLALILVIASKKAPYLSLRDPQTLTPGERLFAVGSSVGLQATITDGVFAAFRQKEDTEERVIQFSAPVNPGNSGGPLIDEKGKVVGVVSWKYISRQGVPVSGVGFAVPSGYLSEEYGAYME